MTTATMSERREQIQQEALSRAVTGQALTNWPAILHGFMAKGIPEHEIRPRENVFTYHAWRALGRQVRRGEHGVKVVTFVTTRGKEDKDGVATNDLDGTDKPQRGGVRRPWTATVFHVSQTDPIEA
ncbi:MAG TPA: ArdC family protein [Gemmataceae bacterium]|nr:ArdC family protein [Gemmataceae bacterium]